MRGAAYLVEDIAECVGSRELRVDSLDGHGSREAAGPRSVIEVTVACRPQLAADQPGLHRRTQAKRKR
jgi:hypothetical protein